MTAPLPRNHAVAEVAEALGESEYYVRERCRRGEWPHRKGARGRPSFTAEDFAAILEIVKAEPSAPANPRVAWAPRSRRGAA